MRGTLEYALGIFGYNFTFDDERDLFECFNYKNYQPLFIPDNLKKNDTITISVYSKSMNFTAKSLLLPNLLGLDLKIGASIRAHQ